MNDAGMGFAPVERLPEDRKSPAMGIRTGEMWFPARQEEEGNWAPGCRFCRRHTSSRWVCDMPVRQCELVDGLQSQSGYHQSHDA